MRWKNIDLFYQDEHDKLVVLLAHTDEQCSRRYSVPSVYQKQWLKSTRETTSYLYEDKLLPILSEQIETLSIERVYDILIGEKGNDKTCEKVSLGVETFAWFLIDISKLNCLENLKSNDGEAMSRHGQALRQMKIEKLSFEENTRGITMKMDVFTYMNMLVRQNAKNIVAAFFV